MAEFKWHLMSDEVPDEGDGDYIEKKKHRDAFMFYASRVEYLPGGVCVYAPNRRDHLVDADTVHAWAEIPTLEVADD